MTEPLRIHRASPGVFDAIFAVIPWPALMLGHDGSVIVTSEEAAAPAARHDAPAQPGLRGRAAHYTAALQGNPPWLTPQEAASTRRLASGALVHERIIVRRTDWGACLIVIDETAQHRQQAHDLQTARLAALGFMVAGVCHEISNPLTSLHSVVQFLRSEAEPDRETLHKSLGMIAASVRRILDISQRLVTFSRVGDPPRSRFAVDVAIDEALQVMRQEGLLGRIDLQWRAAPTALVFGNAGQLSEVFLNLMINAVQAMAGSGRLWIETVDAADAADDHIDVLIGDSGPGIDDAVRDKIFEPFFTTKPAGQGTGLGLAISSQIVAEHGGRLEALPNGPHGAIFRVGLPRNKRC